MIDELTAKRENLEATRLKLQGQLEKAVYDLDRVTDAETVSTDELVGLQATASNLTAAVGRLNAALETIDQELRTAQAAAARAGVLDKLEDAARAALESTAHEQSIYDDVVPDLERIFARIAAASEQGRRARSEFKALLLEHARAHISLNYPATFTPTREEQARQIDAELTTRGVNVSAALEPGDGLRFGSVLWPLIREWQREQTQPLEVQQ